MKSKIVTLIALSLCLVIEVKSERPTPSKRQAKPVMNTFAKQATQKAESAKNDQISDVRLQAIILKDTQQKIALDKDEAQYKVDLAYYQKEQASASKSAQSGSLLLVNQRQGQASNISAKIDGINNKLKYIAKRKLALNLASDLQKCRSNPAAPELSQYAKNEIEYDMFVARLKSLLIDISESQDSEENAELLKNLADYVEEYTLRENLRNCIAGRQ